MSPAAGPRFVAYYRVSTGQQGRSGLGLEAQRAAVARHAAGCGGLVAAAFAEVESGRRGDRPQLGLALAECRLRRAVLLIAKLDRLARDAHFLLGLEKAGVEFVAADMPYANRLTIGVMALVAEEEARATSARTRAALAAAKARGTRLGNPRLQPGDAAAAEHAKATWSGIAARRAAEVAPYVSAARKAGATTLRSLRMRSPPAACARRAARKPGAPGRCAACWIAFPAERGDDLRIGRGIPHALGRPAPVFGRGAWPVTRDNARKRHRDLADET